MAQVISRVPRKVHNKRGMLPTNEAYSRCKLVQTPITLLRKPTLISGIDSSRASNTTLFIYCKLRHARAHHSVQKRNKKIMQISAY